MTANSSTANDSTDDLPEAIVDQAERLTRRAREAVDDNEAAAYCERRNDLLAEYGYMARIREDEPGDVLVLHPSEWIKDGRVHVERIEDTARAVKITLEGPGTVEDWAALEEHNRAIAEQVMAEHGPVHGANAHAFADFMGNHYARPIEETTSAQVEEFLTRYFPRNAWPDEAQRTVVEESLEYVFAAADVPTSPLPDQTDG